MKKYIVTDEDVVSLNKLLDAGRDMAEISRDETEHAPFECGILSEEGYFSPLAYGGGKTITDAINEALGIKSNTQSGRVSESAVNRAMTFLAEKKVKAVVR